MGDLEAKARRIKKMFDRCFSFLVVLPDWVRLYFAVTSVEDLVRSPGLLGLGSLVVAVLWRTM